MATPQSSYKERQIELLDARDLRLIVKALTREWTPDELESFVLSGEWRRSR